MAETDKKKINVKNVSKKFDGGHVSNLGVLARIIDFIKGKKPSEKIITAAEDISFEVSSGEMLGLIGKNGSGKSTLLRIIAGIYEPDQGDVVTHGSLMYINGFNFGTRPRLTMRDNIFLVGSIFGMSKKDIQERFDDIVDFSGLREFLDMKLYQFSSGMQTRLNFSIFIHCASKKTPDILLLDEILGAGGDVDFNTKAAEKMEEFMKGGAAVVLASHNLSDIKKYCKRVLWIDHGTVMADGSAEEVIEKYNTR